MEHMIHTKRREFLKTIGLSVAGSSLVFPFVSRVAKRDSGIWTQNDNGLWSLNFEDTKNRVLTAGCTIGLRTIGGIDDKRIVVSNSQFARPLPSGLTWSRARVAIRFIMNNTAANLTSTPQFLFGFCSGTTNQILDATTTHFAGVEPLRVATWEYNSNAGNPYYKDLAGAAGLYFSKRVNTTTTSTAAQSSFTKIGCDAANGHRQMLILDATKGSPNFTFDAFNKTSFASSTDLDQATFLSQIQLLASAFTGHAFNGATALAVNESDGTLDSVNFAWNRSSPTMEICDLAVVKMA